MLVFPRKLFRKLIPFRLLCCLIDCCSLSCALLVSAAVCCFRRYSAVHASFFPCVCQPPPFLPFQANLICRRKNIMSLNNLMQKSSWQYWQYWQFLWLSTIYEHASTMYGAIKTANTAKTAMHIFIYLFHGCSANPSLRAYLIVPWLLGACRK